MADLIDRQTAITTLLKAYPLMQREKLVEVMETVPAEVVRCKNCKHIQHDTLFGQYWCKGRPVTAEWYCADAERRTDE